MDIRYIETILEKFWNAEATTAEENELRAYFNQPNVDETVRYAQAFFTTITDESDEPADFTTSIIRRLLEKYYDANTSLEEEALLKEYFAQEKIDETLMAHKAIFRSQALVASVRYTKPLKLKERNEAKTRIISLTWIKVAAAAMFLAIGGYFIIRNSVTQETKVIAKARYIEPDNPEEALEYTLKALAMVSRKYKKGEAQLLEGMKTMNNAKGVGN